MAARLRALLLFGGLVLLGLVSSSPAGAQGTEDLGAPTISFTPASGAVSSTAEVAVTIHWSDDQELRSYTRRIWLNGQEITGSFSYSGTTTSASSEGTITLLQGVTNTLEATICDGAFNCAVDPYASASYTFVPPAPSVSVSPDGGSATTIGGSPEAAQTFTVTNGGTAAETYALSVKCAGTTINCVAPAHVLVAGGSSESVDVAYATSITGGPGRIQLVATRLGSTTPTDTGWVDVTVPGVRRYTVSVTPDAGTVPIGTGASATQTFKVANLGNTGATGASYNLSVQCTGAISCPSPGIPASQALPGGQWLPINVSYTAAASAGTGRIRLLAASTVAGSAADSGWVNLIVQGGGVVAPQVSVAELNPRGTHDRSDCMRISLAVAESECGDLVMGHGLASIRVVNKVRAPMLLYSSQTAHPRPVVRANVTLPAGSAVPSSVTATLKVNNAAVATATWPGSSFPAGSPKRVALGFDALSGYATGLYPYSLEVSATYAGGVVQSTSVIDTMAIVNRAASPFGAGWWVAGMEQVVPLSPNLLWIGGDGSTRLYRPAGTNRWLADDTNGTDAIVLVDGSYYARRLIEGGEIRFTTAGYETTTVNRLGMVTTFTWDSGRNVLTNISLPSGTGFTPPYSGWSFSYAAAGLVDSVSVEGVTAGSRRTVKVGRNGAGDVTSLTDPDNLAEGLAYTGAAHVVTGTTLYGRSGAASSQTVFGWDGAGRVTSLRQYGGGMSSNAQDVVLSITNPETRGWMGTPPPDTAQAYGVVDGPRTDAADVSFFWTGRYGDPRQLQDPLGNQTYVYRRDARFPGSVTMVDAPGGGSTPGQYITRGVSLAYFDELGRLLRTEARNPLGDGRNPTTDYTYGDPRWAFSLTATSSPTGLVGRSGYDALGNVVWQQAGNDQARRVSYFYNALGQVDSVWSAAAKARGERPQRMAYDPVLHNLTSTTSPLGRVGSYTADRIGRDTMVSSPIDRALGRYTVQSTAYDVVGRTLNSTTAALGQSVTVTTAYDDVGRVASTTRTMSPDTNQIGAMTITYRYDALGRTIREIAPDNRSDSLEYNPAGQVITDVTRRSSQLGPTNIVMTYDAAGHLLTRVTPSFAYSARHLADFGRAWDFPYQPLNPDNPSSPNILSGDTAVFTYDGAGNVVTANNHDARVTRSYLPGGAVASETQAIRTYTGADFSQHVYTVGYRYDLEGRRISLKHPSSLRPAVGQDSVAYGYEGTTGSLASVTDPMGNVFGFQYDLDGRLTQRTVPGGIIEANRFDADNRLLRRTLAGTVAGTLFYDTLTYDDRDKVTTAGGTEPASAVYTGMGALGKWTDKTEDHFENTTKVIDPLGNLQWEDRRWVNADAAYGKFHTQQSYRYAQRTGRQLSMQEYSTLDGSITDQDSWDYDAAGNRDWHSGAHLGSSNSYGSRLMQERMQSYYGADDRLRVVDRQRCLTSVLTTSTTSAMVICGPWDETLGQDPSAFEEYRYDALGRRVLVRRRLYEVNGNCTTTYHTCNNAIERYVYDGDQILWEIRTPTEFTASAGQLESDGGTGDFGGRVGYTHGPGMDAPLDLIRIGHDAGVMTIIPHANWRGMYAKGTFADGTTTQGTFSTNEIPWPGPNADAWHNPIAPSQPSNWFGSLILDQRDASGLMYRRNRQYDPATGRFTQEDPIGIAGGLNLYGFGGGDALNYSDPYGLCVGPLAFLAPLCVEALAALTEAGPAILVGGTILMEAGLPGAEPSPAAGIGYAEREIAQGMQAERAALAAARRRAVRQAWSQEAEMVERTGEGTRRWTRAERQELLERGRVEGIHGHHINSVKAAPHLAGNPNNI
ncbi:MAG TPA: RHS repeat-associated core domain-containing protein, partial [Longimicrobiaceae bacterium]|nr:RHS repeat-associated core domain-containing protein [Longimicrobiaceae bacterium]